MPEAIVITGPPGAGKSTVSERLTPAFDPSAYVEGDRFFSFVRTGYIDPWLEDAREQNEVITAAAAAAVGHLARRFHVVYDGVVGPWFLPTFLDAGHLVSVHYAVLFPPLAVCLERVASREHHGFNDPDATRHMWRDFERSIVGLEQHVLDAVESPATLAQAIAQRIADGSLLWERKPGQAS